MTLPLEMSAAEFREHFDRLGMSHSSAAAILGIHPRTVARFLSGEAAVPRVVALAMTLLTRRMVDDFLVERLREARRVRGDQ